jgi:hypothetical protein
MQHGMGEPPKQALNESQAAEMPEFPDNARSLCKMRWASGL